MKAFTLFIGLVMVAQTGFAATLNMGDILGQSQKLSGKTAAQLHARPMVVTFSATWCGPCNALLPRNETLAEKYLTKVEFVQIEMGGSDPTEAQHDAQIYPGFSFFLNNPDTLSNTLGIQFYPTSVILDKNGNIVFSGLADDDFAGYVAAIDSVSH